MTTHYTFKIGEFDCMSVSDGDMNYPVESFAKGFTQEQIEALLREFDLPTTHIHSPYTLLYVDTSEHKVMVDTGVGRLGKTIKEMEEFAKVDTGLEAGTAVQNLRAAGIDPAEVDTVIITHAHPDHVGGNFDENGRLNFANAQYYLWREEWDFWFAHELTAGGPGAPESFVQIARDNMTPLRDRITFIAPDAEIVPGITAIPAPGHTPGHIALSIASAGEELLHVVDTALHPIHLKYPDILLPFDILPEQTIATRRYLCDRAADSGALVFGHHLPPFPSLGYIAHQGNHWTWKPITVAEQV